MNPVTTEGTPSSITAPAAAAAGPPSPAKTSPVVANRANPPPTTGKLTENKIVIISQLFVGGWKFIFSNEEKHAVCLLLFIFNYYKIIRTDN